MAESVTTTTAVENEDVTTDVEETEEEPRIPRERLNQEAKKRREAEKRATELEALLEEQRTSGLPEQERLQKRIEQAEKRAEEAERKASEADQRLARTARERWVTRAAADLNFVDPDDAARYVELDDIESSEDAERAVKRIAKAKKHLLKVDDPKLPGRVLENGQRVERATPESARSDEANVIWEGIQNLQRGWSSGGSM